MKHVLTVMVESPLSHEKVANLVFDALQEEYIGDDLLLVDVEVDADDVNNYDSDADEPDEDDEDDE